MLRQEKRALLVVDPRCELVIEFEFEVVVDGKELTYAVKADKVDVSATAARAGGDAASAVAQHLGATSGPVKKVNDVGIGDAANVLLHAQVHRRARKLVTHLTFVVK